MKRYLKKSSLILVVLYFLFVGCGSKDDHAPASAPGSGTPPIVVNEAEEVLGSMMLSFFTDCLKEGVTGWVAENTLGRLLDFLINSKEVSLEDIDKKIDQIDNKLDSIITELHTAIDKINDLQRSLALSTTEIEKYIQGKSAQEAVN